MEMVNQTVYDLQYCSRFDLFFFRPWTRDQDILFSCATGVESYSLPEGHLIVMAINKGATELVLYI